MHYLIKADKLLARLLGWSGRYTISAECAMRHCILCRVVKWSFAKMRRPTHCADSAKDEGLTP